jgi:hypothetical protein
VGLFAFGLEASYSEGMKSKSRLLLSLLVLAIIAGAAYFYLQGIQGPASTTTEGTARQTPPMKAAPEPTPSVRFPVNPEATQAAAPQAPPPAIPEVDESDPSLREQLEALLGGGRFESLLNLDGIARRLVITVDSATQKRGASPAYSIFKFPDSAFQVLRQGDTSYIASASFARYQPWLELLQQVDAKRLVAIYARFYPVFQAAYHDIDPDRYFNDRLVEVIDHLISTPVVSYPIQVIQAGSSYKFADPKLENLSSAQKLIVRAGPAASPIIRGKLRELRKLVTQLSER